MQEVFPFHREKVLVALSGGVDSAAAAALLLEASYEVTGITFHLWEEKAPCSAAHRPPRGSAAGGALASARRIAAILGIEHVVADLQQPFEDEIVEYFVGEYSRGRTPNPCVVCNRRIKFAALQQKALQLGCSRFATGHYARVEHCGEGGRHLLKKGVDTAKDQSYMLYNLTQEQLARCLFPLGEMTKDEVRARARQFGLPVASLKESQEICFIPGDDYPGFLKRRGIEAPPGPLVDRSGKILGQHRGLPFYTVGQRRGLGITAPHPLYVLEICPADNTIVVGEREHLYRSGAELSGLNLIAIPALEREINIEVKIRYGAPAVPALLAPLPQEHCARLRFKTPQAAVTPGQAAVFYRDELVIGGGTITAPV